MLANSKRGEQAPQNVSCPTCCVLYRGQRAAWLSLCINSMWLWQTHNLLGLLSLSHDQAESLPSLGGSWLFVIYSSWSCLVPHSLVLLLLVPTSSVIFPLFFFF